MSTPKPNSNAVPLPPTVVTPRSSYAASTSLTPGTTLAGRYRIVTLLGRGGMGEVYRADDLELGASVAIKLLPPEVAADPIQVDRFRAEVRLARQISHPNIVRVYDIVQASLPGVGSESGSALGAPLVFLAMEYVDGEDLASLLRRIGRLPQDKAVQIARQLCFAVAASHELGIIHRDLKPANVMIDGRGNARVMDFGVAGMAAQLMAAGDIASGTPTYMAPEQLAGREVSKRSDIYSLGLVLYELFSGKPAFAAQSMAEVRALHQSSTRPESLSRHVQDLDPAIERVISRCLEPEPEDRPGSAIAVAAALPGGDPLAAALAAGETPSPELIAASGQAQTLSPAQAWGRAALVAGMLGAFVVMMASWSMVSRVKPAKSPEVLQDRALEVIHALGYADAPGDSARGFSSRDLYIQRVNLDKTIADKAEKLRARPGAYEFWYRQSPGEIESAQRNGTVSLLSPFPALTGEIVLRSDSTGRLELFAAIAPRRRGESAEVPDATVKRLFELADLDYSRFATAEPVFRPFAPVDSMRSWTGSLADPDLAIRVHLGSVEGRVTYFSVAYPWQVTAMEAKPQGAESTSSLQYAAGAVLALVMLATCRLVWNNIRSGRGDRVGAMRIAAAVFVFAALNVIFVQHRLPTPREILMSGGVLGSAAFAAIEFWFFYLAVEPLARRVYPQALVSWTRVLRGQINDPLVGRHVLVGLLLGSVSVLCTGLFATGVRHLVWQSPMIAFYGRTAAYLGGYPRLASGAADAFVTALMLGAGTMLPLVTGKLAFKRLWVGYLMLILALMALQLGTLTSNPVEGVAGIVIALIPIVSIRRGGMLALVVTHVTIFLGQMLPVGMDWAHWFSSPVLIPAGILAGLMILSARAASSGRAVAL